MFVESKPSKRFVLADENCIGLIDLSGFFLAGVLYLRALWSFPFLCDFDFEEAFDSALDYVFAVWLILAYLLTKTGCSSTVAVTVLAKGGFDDSTDL